MIRIRKPAAKPFDSTAALAPAIWREFALLVHDAGSGDRMIVGQGTLQEMAAVLMQLEPLAQARHMIFMSERRQQPYHFTATEIFYQLNLQAELARPKPQMPA